MRELESCKKDDERHTAQLNKMVISLDWQSVHLFLLGTKW